MIEYAQDGIEPTEAQKESLTKVAARWRGVKVYRGTYALPPGYLSIVLDPNGTPVYGGISPEGDIST